MLAGPRPTPCRHAVWLGAVRVLSCCGPSWRRVCHRLECQIPPAPHTPQSMGTVQEATTEMGVDGPGVLEGYLHSLLPHNPSWLGLDAAPAWCFDFILGHEALLEHTRRWAAGGGGVQVSADISSIRLGQSEELGRHLVATREIAAGEVVLMEPPMLLAPREKSPPYCSTCFKLASSFTCPACGFFLCGKECRTTAHEEECDVLRGLGLGQPAPRPEEEARLASLSPEQRAQAKELLQQAATTAEQQRRLEVVQQYRLLATVRTLLNMRHNPASAAIVLALLGHTCPTSYRYTTTQRRIVDMVVGRLGASSDPALVHHVCAVWDTNAFEVPLGWGTRVMGLYPAASLMTHDCRPNTQQWFTAKGVMVVRALARVAAGTVVTTCYTDPQWATMVRQDHLRLSKHFTCTCSRCRDATELGTFLGSPRCSACSTPMVSTDPLDLCAPWRCHDPACMHTVSAAQVAAVGAKVGAQLKGLSPTDASALTSLSTRLQASLPPTHHILIQLHVSTLFTLASRELREVSAEDLTTLSSIATLVMGVVRRLEEPLSRLSVRMAREEIRLVLEMVRRGMLVGQAARDRLEALQGAMTQCHMVLAWDARMPDFSAVMHHYRDTLQRVTQDQHAENIGVISA